MGKIKDILAITIFSILLILVVIVDSSYTYEVIGICCVLTASIIVLILGIMHILVHFKHKKCKKL